MSKLKRVTAEFYVPADMLKEDVALMIDCMAAKHNPAATVWDTRADFLADLEEGHA